MALHIPSYTVQPPLGRDGQPPLRPHGPSLGVWLLCWLAGVCMVLGAYDVFRWSWGLLQGVLR